AVMKTGEPGKDDPQYGVGVGFPPVANVKAVADGEALHVGPIAITPHATPGHTRGGTTWTWDSCENNRCLHMVFADSLTAVSADGFKFSGNATYPAVLAAFAKSFAVLNALPCDVLVSTHPEFSNLWDRLAKRDAGNADALIDANACKTYAANAQRGLTR